MDPTQQQQQTFPGQTPQAPTTMQTPDQMTQQASSMLGSIAAVGLWGALGTVVGGVLGGFAGHRVVKSSPAAGAVGGTILGSGIGGGLFGLVAEIYYAKKIATSMVGT